MNSKKKILLLGKLPPPYMGPAIATQILLNSELKNRFHLLHLDTRINKSISSMGAFGLGKIFRNVSIYRSMLRICRREKPDLVLIPISQTTMGFLKDAGFIVIASMTGRRIIVQLRGSNFRNWIHASSAITRWMVRRVLKRTCGVIVLGNNLKDLFTDFYPPGKIFVVPNGGNYSIPERKRDTEEFRIAYLANLFESKGVEDVFDALAELKQRTNDPFSADFIGEWVSEKTRNYCLDKMKRYDLPVRIHNSSVSGEKFRFLANADVFVFPPREPEGQPWSITEAMAAGLPVIATDQGAIVESVQDGKNGFIVPSRAPGRIADCLEKLMKDETLRRKMAAESKRIYNEKLTEERMVDNFTKLFEQLTD